MISKTGKEFETLIDSHGPDHVQHLMQKVINALEQLERLASEKDKENSAVDSLQTMVEHLEVEENKKQEERQRNARVSVVWIIAYLLMNRFWWYTR